MRGRVFGYRNVHTGCDGACTPDATVRTEGVGQLVPGSAVDVAGLSATTTIALNIDKTPPTIIATPTNAPNNNGWYNRDVHLDFTCNDALSGIAHCEASKDVATEGLSQAITARADDIAGNVATTTTSLNVDKTPPSIIASTTPTANAGGWYRGSVSVHFACEDALSGIDRCPADINVDGSDTTYIFERTAWDLAGNSATTSVALNIDTAAPNITVNMPLDKSTSSKRTISVTGSVADDNGIARVTVNGQEATLSGNTFSIDVTLTDGLNTLLAVTEDVAGNVAQASVSVTYHTAPSDATPPTVAITYPVADTAVSRSVKVAAEADDNVDIQTIVLLLDGVELYNGTGKHAEYLLDTTRVANGSHTLDARVYDLANNKATATIAFRVDNPTIPDEPSVVAPAVEPTSITTVFAANEFLFTGTNPIQTGVAATTIDVTRIAVLRGSVQGPDGQPLPGVTVTIKDHPEYGTTLSRESGKIDFVANGGGTLVVDYKKAGFLPMQRQITTAWGEQAELPDVVMTPIDPKVTLVDLSSATMQVAQGSTTTDADGSRQATILFPTGTQATYRDVSGTTRSLPALNLRITEYTVGEDGPKRMPASLPPTSAYTYAAEISADEVLANGVKVDGTDIQFNQPVPFYVDNFIGMPVGLPVPYGYYDPNKAAWIPGESGRVIQILGVNSAGLADVDIDGSGVAASVDGLSALGVNAEELTRLATLYPAGTSLWRVAMTHFSTVDLNYATWAPEGAQFPEVQNVTPTDPPAVEPECVSNSIIVCESQTLGETVGVAGTPFTLNYRSDRQPGRLAKNSIKIPLLGTTLPGPMKRIELTVAVAGRSFHYQFSPSFNSFYIFTWDGKDAYGRYVNGAQKATIALGYAYEPQYSVPRRFATIPPRPSVTTPRARDNIVLWRELPSQWLNVLDARTQGLGGWTLDVHHAYDPLSRTLYLGDGSTRAVNNQNANVVSRVIGNGLATFSGDGGPASQAGFKQPHYMAVDAQGNVFISDTFNQRIRKVDTRGIVTTIAGKGTPGFSGDGGDARLAEFLNPHNLAIDRDNNIYISDPNNQRIRKITPDGKINTIAGGGSVPYTQDGVPAISVELQAPVGLAVDPEGNVFFGDCDGYTVVDRLFKIDRNGILTKVAGATNSTDAATKNALSTSTADVKLECPRALTFDRFGNLYVAERYIVRLIRPDGFTRRFAGRDGGWGFDGDGVLATSSRLQYPSDIAVDHDGNVYIADGNNNRIRKVDTNGIITTVAGTGRYYDPAPADLSSALTANFNLIAALALTQKGDLLVATTVQNEMPRIFRIGSAFPQFNNTDIAIPSEDGMQLYQFDAMGRHLRTLNTLTGAVVYEFSYDVEHRLIAIVDGDNNTTTIERDYAGNPLALIAPFGQRTQLYNNVDGFLEYAANPAGDAYTFSYTNAGLLYRVRDPRGGVANMTYQADGRLATDANAAAGAYTLTRTEGGASIAASQVVSPLGRTRTISVDADNSQGAKRDKTTGNLYRVTTSEDGSQHSVLFARDGLTTYRDASGVVTTTADEPDPRFGTTAPVTASSTTTLPSGLASTATYSRVVNLANSFDLMSLNTFRETSTVNGRIFSRLFDAPNRTFTNTSPENRQVVTVVDDQLRPRLISVQGLADQSYSYDTRGRLLSATSSAVTGTRTSTYGYDVDGFLSSVTDAIGLVTRFDRDVVGRVTRTTMPDGRVIDYTYDEHGNVTSITPPGRPRHAFAYTPIDQEADYTPPNVGIGNTTTHYTYNLDKELELITRPDGQRVDFVYNSKGQLESTLTPTRTWRYGYHTTTGKLTSLTDGSGSTLGYTYDGSLLKSQSWSGAITGTVACGYDNNFRLTSESVNGAAINFGYDRDSLLTQAGAMTLTRDTANGLLTGTTLGNTTTTLGYNSFGELANDTTSISGSSAYTASYTRDNLGRITEKRETIQGQLMVYGYSYDNVGRLTTVKQNGVVVAQYDYDANSNRIAHNGLTADYDDQDRLLRYGTTTYSYTANGERMAKAEATPIGAGITQYQYDVLGNLINATLPDGTQVDYLIDGQQRRIGKKVNGVLTQAFLYRDQLEPIAELDGYGNLVSRFVYASKSHAPDYIIKAAVTYRIVSDHLGSPRIIINTSTGDIAQRLDYDEFGNVTQDTNPGFQPFGFAGGIYDQYTKLTRFGARDYDASIGRWTAKDPIGFEGGDTNTYGYVGEDPVQLIDPTGLKQTCLPGMRCYGDQDNPDLPGAPPPAQKSKRSTCAESTPNFASCMACCSTPSGYGASGGGSICQEQCMQKEGITQNEPTTMQCEAGR